VGGGGSIWWSVRPADHGIWSILVVGVDAAQQMIRIIM